MLGSVTVCGVGSDLGRGGMGGCGLADLGSAIGLGLANVPHAKGGVDAALEYLANPDAAEGTGSQPARASA